MKTILLSVLLLFSHLVILSQTRDIDSLHRVYKTHFADSNKAQTLYRLGQEYVVFKPDTALLLAQQAYKLATKIKDEKSQSRALNVIATVYNKTANYPKALNFYIKVLKIEENKKDPEFLASTLLNIATVYHSQGDDKKAITFTLRADSLINAKNIDWLKVYSLMNLGFLYEKVNKIPASLDYTQKAFALAVKSDDNYMKGVTLCNLGNANSKKNNTTLAIKNYTDAIYFSNLATDEDCLAEIYLGLDKQYSKLNNKDSAEYFAVKSYEISKKDGFLNRKLDASIFLNQFYNENNDTKNAYNYQAQVLLLKDSIFSNDRVANAQIISMEEDLRQKELAEKKVEEEKERKSKLQLLGIGLSLPILFFITLYLYKKKIKPKYIEILGLVSLLLSFEYIMLLIHPLVVKITNHVPLYQLLIFAIIAAVISPTHHKIESWLLEKIGRKHN